jgi:hypothetical protein
MEESKLDLLLKLADRGSLAQQPDFEEVREKIAGFLGVSNDASLGDELIKKSYRTIRDGVALLKRGQPWTIFGHRFRLTREKGLRVDMPGLDSNFQQVIVETLTLGKELLRHCRRRGCPNLFVKKRRQEYCTKRCSGLARIRKHRSKKITKRVATGSQPNSRHPATNGLVFPDVSV